MVTVVTGAGGFLGRAVVAALRAQASAGDVRLVDRDALPEGPYERLQIDLAAPGAVARVVAGASRILHLAAVPGGAAEADPHLSAAVNLHATLALAEAAAAAPHPIRLVYASSIAVFGSPLPAAIDDATPVMPTMTYGTHKAMVELALADLARRGALDALSLRLPGIVARPPAGDGLKSAFMSDLFQALRNGRDIILPVGPAATMWLLSASTAAEALLHAARLPLGADAPRILTLPALRVVMATLVAEVSAQTGGRGSVGYAPDAAIEAQFGRLPPLATPAADALGLRHDGSVADLVRRALAGIAQP